MEVKNIAKKYNIGLDECIVVGVSGGADSMCLLHKLGKIFSNLVVVHVNHNLRGAEAKRDEEFVRSYCLDNSINFECVSVNVEEFMRKNKSTIEEAARILRFEAFNTVAHKYGADYIFLAHNADDVTETFLINLFRGTGIQGLCSIEEKRENIIRPLIHLTRNEIEEYNKVNGVKYIHDSTNFENEYTRNKIRNILIPFVKENINQRVNENIYRAITSLKEYRNFFDKSMKMYEGNLRIEKNIAKIYFENLYDIVITELIRKAIDKTMGLKDITKEHVDNILELTKKYKPVKINLPKNHIALRQKDHIIICDKNFKVNDEVDVEIKKINDEILVDDTLFIRSDKSILKNVLSYDKIKEGHLRKRKNGDFIILNKKIKLKDFLIKRKVDIFERDKLLVVAVGQRIVWIQDLFIDPQFVADNEECIEIRSRCER